MADFERLSFHLLHGKPEDAEQAALNDRVYRFWKTFWNGVYRSVGGSNEVVADDFVRQDYISTYLDGDDVVALHAYTFLDVRFLAQREHSYFTQNFTEAGLRAVQKLGLQKIMTMEYFSVAPQWRSRELGMSLASIVCGVGMRFAQSLGVDGVVGSARADVGVDKIGKAFGAETVHRITAHNRPTDLMIVPCGNMREHPNPEITRWVRYFYNSLVQRPSTPGFVAKRAA